MKTDRFRSFGFMLAVIIGGGVVGWILFPLFTAFGVGLAAAIDRKPEIDPMTLAIGYYRVHSASHTHAIVGAILGSLTAIQGVWRKKSF
jgi:hypothetical protein